jgi:hypothetical protein
VVYLSCLVDDPAETVQNYWKGEFYRAKKAVKKKWDGPWEHWVIKAARESVHRDASGVRRRATQSGRPNEWAPRVFEVMGEVTLSSACGSKRKADAVSQ